MVKKVFGIIKFIIAIIFSWLINVAFVKDKKSGRLDVKKFLSKKVNYIVDKNFINDIKIFGGIEETSKNKIDILISNHNSTIDFLILIKLMYKFNIKDYYFIFKESISKIPILGSCMIDDIKLKRKWEDDKDYIIKQLNEIEKGLIIIYPEGTRFDNKKYKESKLFCKNNNLPILNYTLTPRIKGTHLIITELKKTNRLGNIYDVTLTFDNFIKKELYLTKILKINNLGPVTIDIKKIKFNETDFDYEELKKKIYKVWLKKNILIDNIYKKNVS